MQHYGASTSDSICRPQFLGQARGGQVGGVAVRISASLEGGRHSATQAEAAHHADDHGTRRALRQAARQVWQRCGIGTSDAQPAPPQVSPHSQRKFAADATERPQLISSKRVEQLRRLISHLSAPYSTVNYLQEYTDSRCKFIRTTLKKLSSDVPPMLADGLGCAPTLRCTAARLVLTLPRYPRGSHRVIMVTRAVLQLLLHEQWLSGSVLPHTAYDTAQTPITEAAVDALCGEGEMLTKDRGTETILPAMDACQTLSGLLPKFREILDGVRK